MSSFATLLDDACGLRPAEIALIDGDRCWSYADLQTQSRRLALGLAMAGVRSGDRVALHMLNRAELAALYFACARLGVIAVPINTRLKPAEVEFVLRHSGACAYVGAAALAQPVLSALPPASVAEMVFVLDPAQADPRTRPYSDLLGVGEDLGPARVDPDELAVILYTSGSTDRPKGVVLSHRAVIAGALIGQPGICAGGVVAQATSMMHAGGFSNLVASVHAGSAGPARRPWRVRA
jgi:acyl-CoA synthetase (AMP-forming)/AMP-acid ligase II